MSCTISVPVPSLVKNFSENAVLCAVGDHVHAPHAAAQRSFDGRSLGSMPSVIAPESRNRARPPDRCTKSPSLGPRRARGCRERRYKE